MSSSSKWSLLLNARRLAVSPSRVSGAWRRFQEAGSYSRRAGQARRRSNLHRLNLNPIKLHGDIIFQSIWRCQVQIWEPSFILNTLPVHITTDTPPPTPTPQNKLFFSQRALMWCSLTFLSSVYSMYIILFLTSSTLSLLDCTDCRRQMFEPIVYIFLQCTFPL